MGGRWINYKENWNYHYEFNEMLTPFGQEIRRRRIARCELLIEMANSLGITSAELSARETGRIAVDEAFVREVMAYFKIPDEHFAWWMNLAEIDA